MTIKDKLKLYKFTKDINVFKEIEEYFSVNINCNTCQNPIIYPNTFLRISKDGNLKYEGTSCKTKKLLNSKEYYLQICDICMSVKFGEEYDRLNKSRIYNTLNKFTHYAFNIPDDIYNDVKSTSFGAGVSLKILQKRHGKNEGKYKWEQYKKRQAYSNTYEYKRDNHGWTIDKFNKFNKTRAVTLNNLISKYGDRLGYNKWNEYLKKQSYTCSYEYFIKQYGEELGNEKWYSFINSKFFKNVNYSKSSQELFNTIDIIFNKQYKTYYALKNSEFNKLLNGNILFLDYFIKELNIAIEYNGDKFHANPKIYCPDSTPNPFNNIKASEIWNKDKQRYISLHKEYGIKTLVIWSSDIININKIKRIIYKLAKSNDKYWHYNRV